MMLQGLLGTGEYPLLTVRYFQITYPFSLSLSSNPSLPIGINPRGFGTLTMGMGSSIHSTIRWQFQRRDISNQFRSDE